MNRILVLFSVIGLVSCGGGGSTGGASSGDGSTGDITDEFDPGTEPRLQMFDGTGATSVASIESLAPGSCISTDGNWFVSEVHVMNCHGEGTNEMQVAGSYLIDAIDGAAYPGSWRLDSQAYDGCQPVFEVYTGTPFWESELDIITVAPSRSTWSAGDREVICMVSTEPAVSSFAVVN